jgi:hypothetical protein
MKSLKIILLVGVAALALLLVGFYLYGVDSPEGPKRTPAEIATIE